MTNVNEAADKSGEDCTMCDGGTGVCLCHRDGFKSGVSWQAVKDAERIGELESQLQEANESVARMRGALESIAANHMETEIDKRHLNKFTTEEFEDCVIEDTKIARAVLQGPKFLTSDNNEQGEVE